ncbi:MAG: hypothetical protein WBM50_10400 [Acidimicrobiales bacterium]
MAEPDFFDAFQAGREALRRMQESFARYAMPPEQRQALADGMTQLLFPTDGVRAMSDFIDAFGPPLAQIEALREELAEQRDAVRKLDDRLAHMEATAERLAIAAEQIQGFQEPFVRMASMVTGQDFSKRKPPSDGAQDGEDEDGTASDAEPTRKSKPGQKHKDQGKRT